MQAPPIVIKATRALLTRAIGIDLLVSVAAIGAIIIGEYWEAAAVTFLFAVGHALEAATLNKTRSALAELVAVAPDAAVVLRDGHQVEVPANEVAMGEIVLVKNGAKVPPVDGEVVAGTGSIDEARSPANRSRWRSPRPITSSPAPSPVAASCRCLPPASGGPTPPWPGSSTGSRRPRTPRPAPPNSWTASQPGTPPAIMVGALAVGLITSDVVLALTLLVIGCPGAW